jgi:dolichyl-phosphate-mannose--protein O-mannosyl transferase
MVGTESDPTHYALARSYYAGQVSVSGWPPAVAQQRLRDVRSQLFHWIAAEVRIPVALSTLAIPLFALLVRRAPSDRWAIAMLALVLAFLIPLGTFI